MAVANNTGAVRSAQAPCPDWGFVYLIGHRQMPDVYKIGKSINHPKRRCLELSRSTSSPGEFSLLMYIESENHGETESDFHRMFSDHRVTGRREFFRFAATDLGGVISTFSENSSGVCRICDEDELLVGRLFDAFPYLVDSVLKCYPEFAVGSDGVRVKRDVRDFLSDNADSVLVELAGKGVL